MSPLKEQSALSQPEWGFGVVGAGLDGVESSGEVKNKTLAVINVPQ